MAKFFKNLFGKHGSSTGGGINQSALSQFQAGPFGQAFGLLPPTGDFLQSLGLFGPAEGTAANQLFGIKSTQLLDLISSMGLQKAFLPQFAEQELELSKQILPGQLAFQGDLFSQALGQAGGAFGGLGGLGEDLLSTARGGLAGFDTAGFGQVPGAIEQQLGESYASSLARFGLEGSPAGATQAASAFAATKAGLGEQLRQSRINQALGIQQGGLAYNQFLTGVAGQQLGGIGLPDIGFGPIGFQGAAGLYTGSTELLAGHRAGQQAKRGAAVGALGNIFGSSLAGLGLLL